MTSFETIDKEQRVKASVQRDVQAMCTEACHFLGLDIAKPAMDLIFDVFFHKMTCCAEDLERFAKHAKRSMITSDDCRLLTRRNNALTVRINSLKLPGSTSKETAKRRRTATTGSSPKRARTVEKIIKPSESPAQVSEITAQASKETVESEADIAIDLTFD